MLKIGVFLLGLAAATGQAGPEQNPQVSDIVFKNVRVLKGIPVDEFMDTMGMFASSLGYDCSSCHSPEIRTNRDAFAIETPLIQRARGMITMMNTLNRTYFRGEPRVSCFTCHRGNYSPEIIPSLALQYGELKEDPNAIASAPRSFTWMWETASKRTTATTAGSRKNGGRCRWSA